MSNQIVNSEITEFNEDGSYTTTTITTAFPLTTAQKAAGWATFAGVVIVPFVPLLAIVGLEAIKEKNEARKTRKNQKSETD